MDEIRKKRLIYITVILLFLIFASYNISMAVVNLKYNRASEITQELEEVMSRVQNDSVAYSKLEEIKEELEFINGYCFDEVVVN